MGFGSGNFDDLGAITPPPRFSPALPSMAGLSAEVEAGLRETAERRAAAEQASIDGLAHLGQMADDIAALKAQSADEAVRVTRESTRTKWLIGIAAATLAVALATLIATLV